MRNSTLISSKPVIKPVKEWLVLILFSIITLKSVAQVKITLKSGDSETVKEDRKTLNQANYFFDTEQFQQALELYLPLHETYPSNPGLNYAIAESYIKSYPKYKAYFYFNRAYNWEPKLTDEILYYLALSSQANLEFDRAIDFYRQFKKESVIGRDPEWESEVSKRIEECKNGKELVSKPVNVKIENLGPELNSKFADYHPYFLKGDSTILFTSRRESSRGGEVDIDDNQYFEDVLTAVLSADSVWSSPEKFDKNTSNHDALVGISHDETTLIMYKGSKNGGDLYLTTKSSSGYSSAKALPKTINTTYSETSACFSPGGDTIYFVSNTPKNSEGGKDIFMSTKTADGEWGEAVNLGKTINTPYDEDAVAISPDGKTLYFSSKGHNTMGGYDIFSSSLANNRWQKPENMGFPINNADDNAFFTKSETIEDVGYFTTTREDSYGDLDNYKVTFLPDTMFTVSGVGPANTWFYATDAEGNIIDSVLSDANGNFRFKKLITDPNMVVMIEEGNDGAYIGIDYSDSKGNIVDSFNSKEHSSRFRYKQLNLEAGEREFLANSDDGTWVITEDEHPRLKMIEGRAAPRTWIRLVDENGYVIDSVLTDENGNFTFNKLPGNHKFRFLLDGDEGQMVEVDFIDQNGEKMKQIDNQSNGGFFKYKTIGSEFAERSLLENDDEGQWALSIEEHPRLKMIKGTGSPRRWIKLIDENGFVVDSVQVDENGNFAFKQLPANHKFRFLVDGNEGDMVTVEFIDENGNVMKNIDNQSNHLYFKYQTINTDYAAREDLDAEDSGSFQNEDEPDFENSEASRPSGMDELGLRGLLAQSPAIKIDRSNYDKFFSKYGTSTNDLIFRVQVGAYYNPRPGLLDFLNELGEVNSKVVNGLTKFLLGDSFNQLRPAEILRIAAYTNGIDDAFIAVYEGNKRIGVIMFE